MRTKHLLVMVLLAACAAEPELGTYQGAVISDAVHANGTAGFYWLPPMVSAPSPTGAFEPASSPTVEIVRTDTNAVVRTFSATIDVDKFQANWDTKADSLSSSVTYRIRVRVPDGRIIGYADVDVVDTGAQVKGVDTAQYVALVDGRTLPIKFRIEHATVDADGDGVLDWADNCPTTANVDQADSVGNGVGDACRCAGATCTAPDACHAAACSATAGCEVTQLLDGTACGTAAICAAGVCMPDTDGDGVIDTADNCPQDANADQTDTVGNGTGDGCRCAALTCSAPDACHAAACSATAGCETTIVADGTSCDTGSSCHAGVCTPDRCDGLTFDAPTSLGTGGSPQMVRAADLNGDGRLDLVTGDYGSGVSVYLNNGAGFAARVTYPTDAYASYTSVGDINNDGKLDVVVSNYIVHKVSVLLGNGNGTLQPYVAFATCSTCGGGAGNVLTELGDANGDGTLDLAIGYTGGEFEIWNGNGNGTFTFNAFYNLAGGCCDRPVMARFGDLNHDGRNDIVVANQGTNVAVLMNAGGGAFTGPVRYGTANYPTQVELTDLDGDGNLDVVAGTQVAHIVTTLLGNGTGVFGSRHDTAALGDSIYGIAVADFDGDGKPDVAAAARAGQPATVYVGNGDGSVSVKTTVNVAGTHDFTSAVAGDFDGDGKPDLAVVDYTAPAKVHVFTNACP